MGNRVFAFALAFASLAACGGKGSEECRKQAQFYEDKCVAETSGDKDRVRATCHHDFDDNVAKCEALPPEVRACDESEAKDHATWAADKHCQDVLTDHYKKTHPGE